jgi:exodeoxyribonuclease VII small subunit
VNSDSNTLPTLEQSLTEITQLIDKMEQGELTLEQSLQDFERGVTLVKHCQAILKEAEIKVNKLTEHPSSQAQSLAPYEIDKNNEDNL